MFDEENVPQQEVVEESSQQPVAQESTVSAVVETPQQINFRKLREESFRYQKERDEALKLVGSLKQQRQAQTIEDDTINLGPDDLAEGKHLSKVQKTVRDLERKVELNNTQLRLRSEFPDFNNVVTADNIEHLKMVDPDMARLLETSTDLETVARLAYKAIKKDVLAQVDPYLDDKLRAQYNAAKPRPLASVSPQQGDSPLSKANAFANGLTDELKQQLLKEMVEARKSR